MQVTDDSSGSYINNFGKGICGNDPKHLGHGLCQKCASQLYANDYDCTGDMKCMFGVTGGKAGANVTVLVGWSQGAVVSYAPISLPVCAN